MLEIGAQASGDVAAALAVLQGSPLGPRLGTQFMQVSGKGPADFDLRLKLGCDSAEYNGFTVVIVLNVRGRVVGAVVDSVSDVLELAGELIKPAPEMNTNVDTSFITGIASVGERMLILMDIEALMSSTDMGLMDTTQSLQ